MADRDTGPETTSDEFTDALRRQRVLPVLRTETAAEAVEAALTLIDAGLTMIELTATTGDWDAALAEIRDRRPGTTIGLGTVTSPSTAHAALEIGAAFLVSPWPCPEVGEVARAGSVPFVEGAFSPGEVAERVHDGPVKIFPAHALGPAYLRSLRQLLPNALLIPTGGVTLEEVPAWLDAGALAVGVGSDLWAGDVPARLAEILEGTEPRQPA